MARVPATGATASGHDSRLPVAGPDVGGLALHIPFQGSPHQVIERLAIYVPLVIAITFLLGFITERTGSVLVATTLHEWIDIFADPAGNGGFFWSGLACLPVWMWLLWTWPKRKPDIAQDPARPEATAATA